MKRGRKIDNRILRTVIAVLNVKDCIIPTILVVFQEYRNRGKKDGMALLKKVTV